VLDTHALRYDAHTGDNLSINFQATQKLWGLVDKLEAIVTDNASNITNAVLFSHHNSIRCAAHTLQLAVNDCLEETKIKDLMKKCRTLVTHFRQSV
jgi:hypothetical protein